MVNGIKWTKEILELFLEESYINGRIALGDKKAINMKYILESKIKNISNKEISKKINMSINTINRYIKELDVLYDETCKNCIKLPKKV